MYRIQSNASGTRSIEVSEENLQTIEKYSLFKGLVPSNGIVDEETLDKLKCNVKSYIMRNEECKDLIDLCYNVLYHDNMKTFGLKELIMLYVSWSDERQDEEDTQDEAVSANE